jgi:hypothetical protein
LRKSDLCIHTIVTQIFEDSNHYFDNVCNLLRDGVTLHNEHCLSHMVGNEGLQHMGNDLGLSVTLTVQYFEQPIIAGFRLERRVREVFEMRTGERVSEKSGPSCAEYSPDIATRFDFGLFTERQDLFLDCPVVLRGQGFPPEAPLTASTPR